MFLFVSKSFCFGISGIVIQTKFYEYFLNVEKNITCVNVYKILQCMFTKRCINHITKVCSPTFYSRLFQVLKNYKRTVNKRFNTVLFAV